MVDLRRQILRKPLSLDFTAEDLDKENDNMHIAAYEDDEMLGVVCLPRKALRYSPAKTNGSKAGTAGKRYRKGFDAVC